MKLTQMLIWLTLALVPFTGCTSTATQTQEPYAVASDWLALPVQGEQPVDVFYLYPTVYVRMNAASPLYSDRSSEVLKRSAAMAYQLQATAFAPVANIYAPYYSQCDAASVLSLPFEERDALLAQDPLQDAIAAFDYYMTHYNQGRPFVLAGHSQGSDVLRLLLARYMPSHPEVYERMLAAYCIGTSITERFLAEHPFLHFAERTDDIQVIVSYNTEAPGVEQPNPIVSRDALVINPITWTQSVEPAPAARNLGSLVPMIDGSLKLVQGFADATVDLDRAVVVCSTVEGKLPVLASSAHFPKGVYHSFDYALYYADLTENLKERTAAYLRGK